MTHHAGRLYQHELIDRVRTLTALDPGLDAALMYGSFVKDEADAHSDIEFWLFHTPAAHAALDPAAWCAALAPTTAVLRNEFGAHVAVFQDLTRGEFHFATTDDLPQLATWPERGAPAERMVLLDRSARLRPLLEQVPERAAILEGTRRATEAQLCGERLANWLILTHHLLARGELLRAWDALGHAVRHLTRLARLAEDSTAHWLTPSRAAETELTPASLEGLTAATAPARAPELRAALVAALEQGRRHWEQLAAAHDGGVVEVPHRLLDQITTAAVNG